MREARVNGKLVIAEPEAPDNTIRPDCGTEVQKRRFTCMDGSVTCFYRHKRGQGEY